MIGLSTIIKETGNISGKCTSAVLEQISTSLHEVGRPLMTPDEVMQLPGAKKDAEGRVVRYWGLLREGGLFGEADVVFSGYGVGVDGQYIDRQILTAIATTELVETYSQSSVQKEIHFTRRNLHRFSSNKGSPRLDTLH